MAEMKISCFLNNLENVLMFQIVNLDYLYGQLLIWQLFYTSNKSHSNYNDGILIARLTTENLNRTSKLFPS